MKIVKIPINQLKEYDGNAKIHTPAQVDEIVESIKRYGFNDPLGVWGEDNIILEGHGRLLALRRLGYTEVECIRLDHLSDDERRAYTLVHNSINLKTGLDDEKTRAELLKLLDMDMEAFGLLIAVDESANVHEDDYTPINVPPRVKAGEVWQLGKHTLVCGDSTKAETINVATGGGLVDCLMTDPPYNVDYAEKEKSLLEFRPNARVEKGELTRIENDVMSADDFNDFLTVAFMNIREYLKDGGGFYVWYASRNHVAFETSLKKAGLTVKQQLIWVKNHMVLGRQDYQWKHEPCLYGWKDGAAHYFTADRTHTTVEESGDIVNYKALKKPELVKYVDELLRKQDADPSTVIREDKPVQSGDHPTMKPVRLLARLIANSTKPGETVLDAFGGSGSTLIACEQLGRVCKIIELDEKYASVIVDRYERFTGDTATKIKG